MQNQALVTFAEMEDMLRNYRNAKNRLIELEALGSVCREVYSMDSLGDMAVSNTALACSMRVADYYRQQAKEREHELLLLRFITKKIDRQISYLGPKHKEVIGALYVEGKTYDEACGSLYVARSTLNKRRKEAVDEMCHMV